MDEAANKEMLVVYCAVVLVQKARGGLVDSARRKHIPARPNGFGLGPVGRSIEREIKQRARVPLIAHAALPAQPIQIRQGHGCMRVAHTRALVALRADHHNLAKAVRNLVPAAVLCADNFAMSHHASGYASACDGSSRLNPSPGESSVR